MANEITVDYDFTFNDYGKPIAKFSMGSEAIGQWFTEELGSNTQRIQALLAVIDTIEKKAHKEHEFFSHELRLHIDSREVEITPLSADAELDEIPEDIHLYQGELNAGCGLIDFKEAVLEWAAFVSR